MPKISVIIPVYNKQKYIKESIQSVINQRFNDFEIIIIDDGSTDQSGRIIKKIKDERIRFYQQKNQGVSFTRNFGVEISKGNLIAFLDADDYWYPSHLQTIWQLHKRFPNAHFFSTGYEVEYPSALIKKFASGKLGNNEILLPKFYRFIKGSPLFYTSNFAIKKEIFLAENGFKPHIHGEDTEFFLRLGFKYNLAYHPKITLRYKKQTENSLFLHYKTEQKELILDELKEMEMQDPDLKKILDLNRFIWAIEYKMAKKDKEAQRLIEQINPQNINLAQKILLKSPDSLLIKLKTLQKYLIQKKIYISPFKKS